MPCSCYKHNSCFGPLRRLLWFGFLCPCHESEDEYDARDALEALHSLEIKWRRCKQKNESMHFCAVNQESENVKENTPTNDHDEKEPCTENPEKSHEEEVVWLTSTLRLMDYPEGPVLQITSHDDVLQENDEFVDDSNRSHLYVETGACCSTKPPTVVATYWIPLYCIGQVQCCQSTHSVNIVIVDNSKDETELLRFQLTSTNLQEDPCADKTVSFSPHDLIAEAIRSLVLWDKFRQFNLLQDFQREQEWLLEKEIATPTECSENDEEEME